MHTNALVMQQICLCLRVKEIVGEVGSLDCKKRMR